MSINLKNDFYIVRHGKSKNNMLGIESCKMETQILYGLIPESKKAVQEKAKRYANFDLIFSSPFRRTQETAAHFVKTSQCDLFLDNRQVDIDLGDFDQSSYVASNEHLKNILNMITFFQMGKVSYE
jgi:broad specificity phosphatase PhoE